MARIRDSQRSRVYASDKALIAIAAKLPAVSDIERYVAKVWASKRVQEAFPKSTSPQWGVPTVSDGRGRRKAGGNAKGIKMPTWSRDEAVTLHELAHTIFFREYTGTHAVHGWLFCSIYLKLVLYVMGREAHDVLKAAFKQNRVRFTEPRQRKPLSPERRAELVARLASYRAAQQMAVAA